MRSAGGSAAGAGCGAFGLLGLLIGVAITFYLGSLALDGTLGGSDGGPKEAAGAMVTVSPDPAPDGSDVQVASNDFVPTATITLTMCLTPEDDGSWRCDPDTAATDTVDALGELRTPYRARRMVTVDRKPVDCSKARCVVRASQQEPEERAGSAPLTVTPIDAAASTTTGPAG